MSDLFYGGWAAPNIYYLGACNCLNVGGVRVCGYSGIYNDRHWNLGHYESAPYDNNTVRSVYHTREVELRRLGLLSQSRKRVDVCVSHDWPQRIAYGGNIGELFRKKKFLVKEVLDGSLGSPGGGEAERRQQSVANKGWSEATAAYFRPQITNNLLLVTSPLAPQSGFLKHSERGGGSARTCTSGSKPSFITRR